MMPTKIKGLLLLLLMGTAATFYACSKYKDPPPGVPNDELKNRRYCNDPRAINYNWGFPGTADSTLCFFPIDSFQGAWKLYDTTLLPDGSISNTQVKNLVFTKSEDTLRTHLAVTGWCTGGMPFYITADKYNKAFVDTMLTGSPGQYICNNTDTLSGTLVQGKDTLNIDFTITGATGTTYHKGTAVRQ